jgi:hypothetical protein
MLTSNAKPPATAARKKSMASPGYPKIVNDVGMRMSIAAPTISAARTNPDVTRFATV